MIGANVLANALPINGTTTGDISDAYPNLFAPAGVTFAIWGLIYLLLGIYTFYQMGQDSQDSVHKGAMKRINLLFSISSLANAAWIIAWHYRIIPVSLLLIVTILICLILINRITGTMEFSGQEKLFIRLPFSIYFGWITVATIANVTTLLVSIGWEGYGLSEMVWATLVIAAGCLIGLATIIRNKDIAYGLTILWAYGGILLKHVSSGGFDGQYLVIINTTVGSMVVLLIALAYLVKDGSGHAAKH